MTWNHAGLLYCVVETKRTGRVPCHSLLLFQTLYSHLLVLLVFILKLVCLPVTCLLLPLQKCPFSSGKAELDLYHCHSLRFNFPIADLLTVYRKLDWPCFCVSLMSISSHSSFHVISSWKLKNLSLHKRDFSCAPNCQTLSTRTWRKVHGKQMRDDDAKKEP